MRIAGSTSMTCLVAVLATGACDRDRVALGPVERVDTTRGRVVAASRSASFALAPTETAATIAWVEDEDGHASVLVHRLGDVPPESPMQRFAVPADRAPEPSTLTIRVGAAPQERHLAWMTTRLGDQASVAAIATSRDDGRSWSGAVEHDLGGRAPTAIFGEGGAGTLLLAWFEEATARHRMFIARSADGGRDWKTAGSPFIYGVQTPPHDANADAEPRLSLAGDGAGTVVVVWLDVAGAIQSMTFHEGGETWSRTTHVNDQDGAVGTMVARIAFAGRRAVVAWSVDGQLLADSSADGGTTWGSDTFLMFDDTGKTLAFDLLGGADVVHVAFQARPARGVRAIYDVAINADGVWSAEHDGMRPVGRSGAEPAHPRLARQGDEVVYVAYELENRVLLARSTDEGATFEPPITVFTASGAGDVVRHPQVAAVNGVAYVAWETWSAEQRIALFSRAVTFTR